MAKTKIGKDEWFVVSCTWNDCVSLYIAQGESLHGAHNFEEINFIGMGEVELEREVRKRITVLQRKCDLLNTGKAAALSVLERLKLLGVLK